MEIHAQTVEQTNNIKYNQYKDWYSPKDYSPLPEDPYSRALAGIASAFIPGLGQGLDGEWGRAAGFFAGFLACSVLHKATSIRVYYDDEPDSVVETPASFCMLLAALAFDVWSICDAVRVAKIKNMYSQDIHRKYGAVSFDVKPCLAMVPAPSASGLSGLTPSAGVALSVRF